MIALSDVGQCSAVGSGRSVWVAAMDRKMSVAQL